MVSCLSKEELKRLRWWRKVRVVAYGDCGGCVAVYCSIPEKDSFKLLTHFLLQSHEECPTFLSVCRPYSKITLGVSLFVFSLTVGPCINAKLAFCHSSGIEKTLLIWCFHVRDAGLMQSSDGYAPSQKGHGF